MIDIYGRILENMKNKLEEAHIKMLYPTKAALLHEQTEERDRDCSKQPMGCPASPDVDNPQPARGLNHEAQVRLLTTRC